jgi:hypothetical protein
MQSLGASVGDHGTIVSAKRDTRVEQLAAHFISHYFKLLA